MRRAKANNWNWAWAALLMVSLIRVSAVQAGTNSQAAIDQETKEAQSRLHPGVSTRAYSPPPPYFGTNPSFSDIKAKLIAAGQKYHIPPQILYGIAFQESGWNQFRSDGRTVYHQEPDGRNGVGIMQMTISPSASDYSRLCTDIDYNIDRGASLLVDKWNQTPIIGDGIGQAGREKLENWYYAIWAYNGFVCPNPYPETVMAHIANGRALWTPVTITNPNISSCPAGRIQNTPSPVHVDADYNGEVDGSGGGSSGVCGNEPTSAVGMPFYRQGDPRWGNEKLGNQQVDTIAGYGCTVTCLAMLHSYYRKCVNPHDMNEYLKSSRGFVSGDIMNWGYEVISGSGITRAGDYNWTTVAADLNVINREVDAGYPVVVETRINKNEGLMHFVVITRRDSGTYYANDPLKGDECSFNVRYGDPSRWIYRAHTYRGTKPAAEPVLVGSLDTPTNNQTVEGVFRVAGWGKDATGKFQVEAVQVFVNGEYIQDGNYGESRLDAGGNVGYSYQWDTTRWSNQTVNLMVRLVSQGRTFDRTATVVVGPNIKPLTVTITSGHVNNGTYWGPQTVKWHIDDPGGSGLAGWGQAWDSDPGSNTYTTSDGELTLPLGTHTLHVHTRDTAGNEKDWTFGPYTDNLPTDGTFVTYKGNVYRIVGGAPVYVGSWDIYGGPQPTAELPDEQWVALRWYPADGTFVRAAPSGNIFIFAGGAPLYVSSWDRYGGPQPVVGISDDDAKNAGATDSNNPWSHVRFYPADGTFLHATPSGRIFRVNAGVPVYVPSWDAYGGPQPVVEISDDNITNAGATDLSNPWSHLKAPPEPTNAPPVNVSLSPTTATDAPTTWRTFTATYSDADSATDINLAALRIGGAGQNSANALLCVYNPVTNKLSIYNDAATALVGSVTPGTATVLSNSQGNLNCGAVTTSKSGNVLTVNWNVSATGVFAGSKQSTFLFVRDAAGLSQGYTAKGTWTIGGNLRPSTVSVSPASASTSVGVEQLFNATFSDPNGWKNLQFVTLRLGGSGTNSLGAMVCVYNVQNNKIYLFDDAGNYVPQADFPGRATVLSNSQGSLDCARTTVTGSGNTLTVKWSVKAKAAFAGSRSIALLCADRANLRAGYNTFGTWTITGAGGAPASSSGLSTTSASSDGIVLKFDRALDATSAANAANYTLRINGAQVEARVEVAASSVTLRPATVLHAGDSIEVAWKNLVDAQSRTLQGKTSLTAR